MSYTQNGHKQDRQLFNDFLDRKYQPFKALGMSYSASEIIETLTPAAYREAFAEWRREGDVWD